MGAIIKPKNQKTIDYFFTSRLMKGKEILKNCAILQKKQEKIRRKLKKQVEK